MQKRTELLAPPVSFESGQEIVFRYCNWRGETALRRATPIELVYGATEWHPEPQWLVKAIDVDSKSLRLFALKDMGPAG